METYYGSAAAYQAYHLARGTDESARSDADIEQALLVASEWLDGMYDWPGYKYKDRTEQIRDWPRNEVWDAEGWPVDWLTVPSEIEHATYEVALRWLTDSAVLNPDHTPELYRRVSIDGALSVEYKGLSAAEREKKFPILATILNNILCGSADGSISGKMYRQ